MKHAPRPPVYFENAAGQLLIEPAGYLRVVWSRGERLLSHSQALFAHMAQALQQQQWSRILIDQRHMPPFSRAEQQWIAAEWLPQAVRVAGYRYGAVLVSPDVMVRLATAYVTTHIQNLPLVYCSFETNDAAVAWLLEQPAQP
ncbi:hypothetical protein [Hymenobacter sp. B81]|uniref:hypothetical protein n=1 Tax=Hymenobacter sp. B81 TaxID=3344878 RepID=UPI0037DCBAA3